MKKRLFLIVFFIFSISCFADDISFETSIDRDSITFGSTAQLTLTFRGMSDISAPQLPEIDGLHLQYSGSSSSMSYVNGQVSNTVGCIYSVIPLKTGTFQIGPFSIDYKGRVYTSNALKISVVDKAVANNSANSKSRGVSPEDLNDRIFIVMQVSKNRVYLNEKIPLTVKLYVNGLGVRDIQPPVLQDEGILAENFKSPRQYQENLAGIIYEVVEYTTDIFGLRTGELKIGPAEIKCNLLVQKQKKNRSGFDDFFGSDIFDEFFGRFSAYPLNIKSADLKIDVLDIPQENRPADFGGAIGEFNFDASASPQEVNTGDPVTLKMVVRGEGNFNTVSAVRLRQAEGFKAYEPQIKREGNSKIFEQIIMPLSENIKEIPQISFSFFNPQTGSYQIMSKGPFPITVNKPAGDEEQKIIESAASSLSAPAKQEILGRDIIFIKEQAGSLRRKGDYLYNGRFFWYSHVWAVLAVVFSYVFWKRRQKLTSDARYARNLRAPKKARKGLGIARKFLKENNTAGFYDAVFKTLQEYLGDKFHLPSGSITIEITERLLKQKNISAEIIDKLNSIFKDCDMARYASGAVDRRKMDETLLTLEEIIDYFLKQKA